MVTINSSQLRTPRSGGLTASFGLQPIDMLESNYKESYHSNAMKNAHECIDPVKLYKAHTRDFRISH